MADFAHLNKTVKRLQRLFPRRELVAAMELVEVHVVCSEPLQAAADNFAPYKLVPRRKNANSSTVWQIGVNHRKCLQKLVTSWHLGGSDSETLYPAVLERVVVTIGDHFMKKSLVCSCLIATCIGGSSTMLHASDGAKYVYVESNIGKPNANSIFAYKQQGDGQLTAVAGSPFLTGGQGVTYTGAALGPFDSDQEIITNRQRTLLFAVNAGSDSIAVFHVHNDGSLTVVEGSPFPSGGSDPVSLGIDGDTLFVVNQSENLVTPSTVLPNYTVMHVQPDGILVPVGNTVNDTTRGYQASVGVALGSSPSQAYVLPSERLVFGADFLGGLLERFKYNALGELHELSPISLPASEFNDTTTPRLPLGLWSNPSSSTLYVGYVTANKLGVYHFGSDGALRFIRTVPNAGQGICWIRSSANGSRLYTTDTTTNQVSVYDSTDPEYPVEIQTLTLAGGGNAFQESLSADGKTLYAISQHTNLLHSLQIKSDGTVSEISTTTLQVPSGARPQGIAVVDE